jgi:hypothetical protein
MFNSLFVDFPFMALKSFIHACIIPLAITLLFHNIFYGFIYMLGSASIYHFILSDREEYFLFSLAISSLLFTACVALGVFSHI